MIRTGFPAFAVAPSCSQGGMKCALVDAGLRLYIPSTAVQIATGRADTASKEKLDGICAPFISGALDWKKK